MIDLREQAKKAGEKAKELNRKPPMWLNGLGLLLVILIFLLVKLALAR